MARSRRGRGEGGVRQRKDGLWVGTVSLGTTATGKRKRKYVYGRTKAEALKKLDEARGRARVGNLPDPGRMTVAQLLDRWLDNLKARVGERTHEEKESLVRVHLKPRIGPVKLSAIAGIHVEALAAELRADKIGPWAARAAIDALDYALTFAVRLRLIPANPCRSIDKPKPKAGEIVFLTPDQAKAFLAATAGKPVGPLVTTALGTGCRSGELLALMWADVTLEAAALTVRRSLTRTKAGGYQVKEPKTKAARRTIALPASVVAAMTELRAQRLAAGLIHAPVFCTRTGGYLSKENVLRAFRAVVRRANKIIAKTEEAKPIPEGIRFHDLRHTHASLLLSDGRSLRAVSQRLGHADPSLTLRVYGHCMPGDDGRLAEAFDKLVG